jgi:hypothetical protein
MMTPEEKWTDHRLDDLDKKVDDGFARADKSLGDFRGEVTARFDKVDARFVKVDERFDKARAELKSEVSGLRGEMQSLGKELRGEIGSLRTAIYLGAGGIIAALIGISAL